MERSHFSIFMFLSLLWLLGGSFSDALCVDSSVPLSPNAPLAFCSYNGTSCCSTTDDLSLQERFKALNISDSACASLLKSILCARCDPLSAELFRVTTAPRQVPALCDSTVSAKLNEISEETDNFCSKVWNTCQNVSIMNSPFASGQPVKSNITKLNDIWRSETTFCNAFGAASDNGSICFGGEPIQLNNTGKPSPPSGMCIEKIGNGSYLHMVPHPDGSNRAFFANQKGIIWLATIPEEGSGGLLELDEANPFLDLTDLVHFDSEFGLMAIAIHPNFLQNGRLFASFNCDKAKWPGCGGRCSCNSDVNCDPSKLPRDGGAAPCQFHSVIAEFTVNDTASQPSLAKSAKPLEVRRIFTMGLPFTSHHGGQILFGPTDGYLYFMMGDGGGMGDPYNFAQNKRSLLGKIMRIDIDNIPNASEISRLGLWGNYSIPKDNPYTKDNKLQPEIWAVGLRNPWRCSFDSARPNHFLCADVGQAPQIKSQNRLSTEFMTQKQHPITVIDGTNWMVSFPSSKKYIRYHCRDSIPCLLIQNTIRGQWANHLDGFTTDQYEEVNIITKGGNYGWRVYEGPYIYTPTNSPGGNTSLNSINPIFPVMGYNHSNVKSSSITGGYFYRAMTDPCMYGRYLFADLYADAMYAGTEHPNNSDIYTTSKIPFTCALDSPLNCTLAPGSSRPALGYIFSFAEDNDKDIFILSSNGVYRIAPASRCNYTCSRENATGDTPGNSSPPPSKATTLTGSFKSLGFMVSCFWLFLMSLI